MGDLGTWESGYPSLLCRHARSESFGCFWNLSLEPPESGFSRLIN